MFKKYLLSGIILLVIILTIFIIFTLFFNNKTELNIAVFTEEFAKSIVAVTLILISNHYGLYKDKLLMIQKADELFFNANSLIKDNLEKTKLLETVDTSIFEFSDDNATVKKNNEEKEKIKISFNDLYNSLIYADKEILVGNFLEVRKYSSYKKSMNSTINSIKKFLIDVNQENLEKAIKMIDNLSDIIDSY